MSVLIKLTVVAVLLGIVFATQKPCCLSKKFTGKMKVTAAYLVNGSLVPVITENTFMIDFDKDMGMERIMGEVHVVNGSMDTTTNYTVYNDYKHNKKYVMSGTDKCEVSPHPDEQINPCVPGTLQHTGTYRMGSHTTGLSVNAWAGEYEHFQYTFLTTDDDCTPVAMTRFGTDKYGTRISESTVYADVTQYMTSQGAFDLPHECRHGDAAVGK